MSNQYSHHSYMQLYKDICATHQQRIQDMHNTHSKMMESYHGAITAHLDRTIAGMESMLQYMQDNMSGQLSSSMLQSSIDGTHQLKRNLTHYTDRSTSLRKHFQRFAMGVFGVVGLSGAVKASDDLYSAGAAGAASGGASSAVTVESEDITRLNKEVSKLNRMKDELEESLTKYLNRATKEFLEPWLKRAIQRNLVLKDWYAGLPRRLTDGFNSNSWVIKDPLDFAPQLLTQIDTRLALLAAEENPRERDNLIAFRDYVSGSFQSLLEMQREVLDIINKAKEIVSEAERDLALESKSPGNAKARRDAREARVSGRVDVTGAVTAGSGATASAAAGVQELADESGVMASVTDQLWRLYGAFFNGAGDSSATSTTDGAAAAAAGAVTEVAAASDKPSAAPDGDSAATSSTGDAAAAAVTTADEGTEVTDENPGIIGSFVNKMRGWF